VRALRKRNIASAENSAAINYDPPKKEENWESIPEKHTEWKSKSPFKSPNACIYTGSVGSVPFLVAFSCTHFTTLPLRLSFRCVSVCVCVRSCVLFLCLRLTKTQVEKKSKENENHGRNMNMKLRKYKETRAAENIQ